MKLWAAGAVVLVLAGCGSKGGGFSSREAKGTSANVFRYPIVTVPTTLDPGKTQDGDTLDVVQQVFEGLVKWNEKNEVAPNLAERWDVSPDGTVYTFHLKPGVKFTNGREVTADDFKWSIERTCNPKFNSPTASNYLADIVGAKDRIAGKAPEVSGVKALDPKTLRITIDKPRPYFLGKMTYACSYVVAKEALGNEPTTDMTRIEQMVGTGPFRYTKIDLNDTVAMAANAGYHGGKPPIDGIERPIVKDAQTRLNLYKNGSVDLVQLERQDLKALQADPALKDQLHFYNRPSVWYVGLQTKIVPQFGDVRVRQAFAMAIDRKTIVDGILGGANTIADGIVPPGVFGHQDDAKTMPYDLSRARQLLASAGYPNGKGFPTIEMSYRENRPDIELVAQAVQQQLKAGLGVNLALQKREWGSYLAKNNAHALPMFHMRWAADYLDAENFLSILLASYGPENKIDYRNPEYDALCRRADTSLDPEERKRLYNQAENIALSDAAFIPIYFQRDAELIRPNVKGLRESVFGHLPHTQVSLK